MINIRHFLHCFQFLEYARELLHSNFGTCPMCTYLYIQSSANKGIFSYLTFAIHIHTTVMSNFLQVSYIKKIYENHAITYPNDSVPPIS